MQLNEIDHKAEDCICRFCWVNEETDQNPILCPCKCSGSVGYIHYGCLKQWLNSKVQEKGLGDTKTFTWKQYECELCKSAFPYAFNYKGQRWDMIEYKTPVGKPYIVLESIRNEKNTSRQVHMIVVENERRDFKIGRGHESDIRINDISVS